MLFCMQIFQCRYLVRDIERRKIDRSRAVSSVFKKFTSYFGMRPNAVLTHIFKFRTPYALMILVFTSICCHKWREPNFFYQTPTLSRVVYKMMKYVLLDYLHSERLPKRFESHFFLNCIYT
uniref:Uncharacterized protein n=1 Tax=Cacopsylla melanoneura TaxID=428564 RepID=A0A8D8LGM1_9HEMI